MSNFCVNCAWKKKLSFQIHPVCTLPGAVEPDPVTGYTKYPLCWKARYPGAKCGPYGKCWEPKPTLWQRVVARFSA
jgi:hypothetical protein